MRTSEVRRYPAMDPGTDLCWQRAKVTRTYETPGLSGIELDSVRYALFFWEEP